MNSKFNYLILVALHISLIVVVSFTNSSIQFSRKYKSKCNFPKLHELLIRKLVIKKRKPKELRKQEFFQPVKKECIVKQKKSLKVKK